MSKLSSAEIALAKTGEVKLTLDSQSSSLVTYFLRDVRGRKDLAAMVQEQISEKSFESKLEEIRTHIENQEFKLAKQNIDNCVALSQEEQSELLLEKARYFFFTENFDMSRDILTSLISTKNILITSRITAYELLGQTYLNLDEIEQATVCLTKSMDFLDLLPYVSSAFVAGAHLIKIKAEQKKFDEAQQIINYLEQQLRGIKQDEVWIMRALTVTRGLCHYYKNRQDTQKYVSYLKEAHLVAEWLDDILIRQRCLNDFKTLGIKTPEIAKLNFLPNRGVLLISNPKAVIRFEQHPVLSKILAYIIDGEKTTSDVFEHVYGLSYDKERHAGHMRAALAKLRKKLPTNSIVSKNGKLSIW